MLKSYLSYIGLAVVLLSATLQSCTKSDGINNNQVILTPYSLYYGDSSGTITNTNDGINTKPLAFPPDGFPVLGLCTSGNNLFFIKTNLQVSINNSSNFNPTYTNLNIFGIPSMCIYNVADQNRVYVASTLGWAYYSDSNGKPNTWVLDTFASNIGGSVSITSYTELANGTLVGYDGVNNRTFIKHGKYNNAWQENTGSSNQLPSGGRFTITHSGNDIVAVDYTGANGAWYSKDQGQDWFQYSGLPNTPLLSVAAPFDQTILIGTKVGIFRLINGSFMLSNNGLGNNTVVYGIVAKENIYVNVVTPQQYVFLATNNGLYVSKDLGKNWILDQPATKDGGGLTSIY